MESNQRMGVKHGLSEVKLDARLQTIVNRCLRHVLRVWCLNIVCNKDLWRVTGQEDTNLEKENLEKGNLEKENLEKENLGK
jgi:hypothetical protein